MKVNWLIHNFWLKLGALLLAFGLWLYVAGEEKVEVELKIPIRLKLAEGIVVTKQDVSGLRIFGVGRKEVISKLMEKQISYDIDFSKYIKPQTVIFPIDPT